MSFPQILPDILLSFIPYALALAAFGSFVVWNGGIVLGEIVNTLMIRRVSKFGNR